MPLGERGVRRRLPSVRASRGGEGGIGSGVEEFLGDPGEPAPALRSG